MNIFILSLLVKACAKYHCDVHVIKMILESTQMLMTSHRLCNPQCPENYYKIAHKNHPCTIWVRESSENYKWLYELLVCLCDEFKLRRKKLHKTEKDYLVSLKEIPSGIPVGPMTPFAVAMPDKYKIFINGTIDPVKSYRNYYIGEKLRFCVWSDRDAPYWLGDIDPRVPNLSYEYEKFDESVRDLVDNE